MTLFDYLMGLRQPKEQTLAGLLGEYDSSDPHNPFAQFDFTPTLAAGDGVGYKSHQQMREAGVGPYEGRAPAPAPTPASYNLGSTPESEMSLQDRQRRRSAEKLGMDPNSTDDQIRAESLRRRRK